MRVEVVDSYEALFWKAVNLRHRYVATYDALVRSTIQQILELVKFRDEQMPNNTRKEIAQAFQTQLVDTGSQVVDKIDFSFVDSALKVHDRMLCHKEIFNAIMEMDSRYGKSSCLNYIRVLEIICMKGKDVEQLWIIHSIMDYLNVLKEISNKDLSTRALQGSGGSNRGMLDMFLAKRKMMLWLVDHLNGKNVPHEWVEVLKGLQSHKSFREKVGGSYDKNSGGADRPDRTWLGTEHEVVRITVDIMKAGLRQLSATGCLSFFM